MCVCSLKRWLYLLVFFLLVAGISYLLSICFSKYESSFFRNNILFLLLLLILVFLLCAIYFLLLFIICESLFLLAWWLLLFGQMVHEWWWQLEGDIGFMDSLVLKNGFVAVVYPANSAWANAAVSCCGPFLSCFSLYLFCLSSLLDFLI